MMKSAYIKTALIAVLFFPLRLNASEEISNSVQCFINNKHNVLVLDNSTASSVTLKTSTHSQLNQYISGGKTKFILNAKQFPLTLEIKPENKSWKIFRDCTMIERDVN
ncbi:hypothetical protein [Vibrio coralliirubri]|uniref:hypothetical protein n=1 Tax=Vibrio coralliirubri TaxID=1516159 RepID=UPI00065E03F2|nr:hypothetical protein [Vibrio coralliirubri]